MKTPSQKQAFLIAALIIAFGILIAGNASAQDPTITVRFANPQYNCSTQTYKVDVQFQSDTPNKEICLMNVRFYYDDSVLEFQSFGDFPQGYGVGNPNPVQRITGTTSTGMELLGFTGPQEWINGGVKKNTTLPRKYISTTGWTKLFCMNFHVDDPTVMSDSSFCPSLVWDKLEDPSMGGISGTGGVLYTVVAVSGFPGSSNAIENVEQFNWEYDSIPGNPHGSPVETDCLSTMSSYAPGTFLPFCGFDTPGNVSIPVTVTNFNNIGSFSLVFEYDTTVVDYLGFTANTVFNSQNGLLNVTDLLSTGSKRKLQMTFTGVNPISLPDSANLANISFNYLGGTANLDWLTDAGNCYFINGDNITLCDEPDADFYQNGAVVSMLAPITKIDSVVAIAGGYATFCIRVWDFVHIYSGTLTLNYDPTVLSFDGAVANTAINTNFNVNDSVPGAIELAWCGSEATLADGSELMYVTFQYLGGSAPLTWFDNGSSCQYTHCLLTQPLTDSPTSTFYLNGNITSSAFVWSGETSGDWSDPANWENNVVPDQFTSVTIDPAANPENWPSFTGDFALGVNCKNLTLSDGSYFTINGDFSINPGNVLTLNGSSVLQISGNWINSGVFIPGTGTVEFTGSDDVIIDEGVPAGNFLVAYVHSDFTAGMIPLGSAAAAGPTGDNAHSDVNIGFDFNFLGTTYTQARINTNGWISLNLSGNDNISADNTALFNTALPTVVMSPWWDDLAADASTAITYLTDGVSPLRVFTVEWKNILSYSSNATSRLNFQVKLYETTGIIEFHYGTVTTGTHNTQESASVGLKDDAGGQGHFIEATQNSTNIALAVLKSSNSWPQVNYRFIPPAENVMDIFHKIIVSKTAGNLSIARDVKITGLE